ncbi:MAG: hypothetical protein AAGF84_01775 [Planctomycetota bacterium]
MPHGDDPESRLDRDFEPLSRDPDAMQDGKSEPPPPAPTPLPPPPPAAPGPSRVQCLNCGYDLTGATIGGSCPECGMIIGGGTLANAQNKPTSGNAIAALVLGICAIVMGCGSYGLLSLVLGPLAIWFARQARADMQAGNYSDGSKSLATAGQIMGWIATILALIVIASLIGFFCLPGLIPGFMMLFTP